MGGFFMNILSKIKLTVTQWVIVVLASVVGVLVIALGIQGGKLHRAKVKLIEKDLDIATIKDDENIADKKKKLRKAKKELKESK
jgi:hypothetical protein